MTKEYAIQILREMIPKFARCDTDVKRLNAINMAIKSLGECKTGKWINRHYVGVRSVDTVICSECGDEFGYDAETGVSAEDYNYCPHCGAKMKGAEE